jgi:pterin-4a-carbinolamine dehydratase
MDTPPQGWKAIERPAGLFRRYDFESYAQTRLYLELLAKESERVGRYPDLSFGPRHVNVTIAADGESALPARALAIASDGYAEQARQEGLTNLAMTSGAAA